MGWCDRCCWWWCWWIWVDGGVGGWRGEEGDGGDVGAEKNMCATVCGACRETIELRMRLKESETEGWLCGGVYETEMMRLWLLFVGHEMGNNGVGMSGRRGTYAFGSSAIEDCNE